MIKPQPRFAKTAAIIAAASLGFSGLLVGGAAVASPASADPAATNDSVTETVELPADLQDAIVRDLGISPEQYQANADLTAALTALTPALTKLDGFVSVSVVDGVGVITVSAASDEITALAKTVGASVVVLTPVAQPAASVVPADRAPVTGDAYVELVQQLFAIDGVTSVGQGANGEIIVRTTVVPNPNARAIDPLSKIASAFDNVTVVTAQAPLEPFATNDVVGGAGYAMSVTTDNFNSMCSIGFTAWDATGKPAALSAGHCTGDDNDAIYAATTTPTDDDAYGGLVPSLQAALGTFNFAQWGAPGSTVGEGGNLDETDVSVIDVTNGALNLKPAVTKWADSSSNDLAANAVNITSVSSAVVGADVCKSGRTTGWSCGTVSETNGWAAVGGRYVYGFMTDVVSDHGDSGGSMITGQTAVGLLSGGNDEVTWGTDLPNALRVVGANTGGYTVQLFVDAPVLTSPANGGDVERGQNVSGTAPAGSVVIVTIGADSFEATTNANGNWSFPTSTLGALTFSVQAVNGFNESASNTYTVNVVPAPLLAPAITNPAPDAQLTVPVTAITGTGTPGAIVTLTGDAAGTATVADNGTWTVELATELSYGSYTVSATQALEGQTSPAAVSNFSIVMVAPVITNPANGTEFAHDKAPNNVSGTGIEGATVTVSIDGIAQSVPAIVVDGNWQVLLDALPASGTHTITAIQSLDGVDSAVATSTFIVAAAPGAGTGDDGSGTGVAGDGDLASTGISALPAALAGGVLLIGGALFMLMRRRQQNA